MALKQTSFDFDFFPEENQPAQPVAKPVPPTQVMETEVIDLVSPVEIDVIEVVTTNTEDAPRKSTRGRMKLSDMNASADKLDIPDDAVLFEKSYYSIGAVSEMFKVNQSLIRFWENEFSILKPKKNAKGDRFFRPEDVKNLKLIYHLLRERKYTIEGAKEFLKKNKSAEKKFEMIESLKNLQSFLSELKANL
jgi:DNA-binding transcriptional MerR regulator